MGRTACTGPLCLYKSELYFFILTWSVTLFIYDIRNDSKVITILVLKNLVVSVLQEFNVFFLRFWRWLESTSVLLPPQYTFLAGGERPSFILIYKQQTQHRYQRQFTV